MAVVRPISGFHIVQPHQSLPFSSSNHTNLWIPHRPITPISAFIIVQSHQSLLSTITPITPISIFLVVQSTAVYPPVNCLQEAPVHCAHSVHTQELNPGFLTLWVTLSLTVGISVTSELPSLWPQSYHLCDLRATNSVGSPSSWVNT